MKIILWITSLFVVFYVGINMGWEQGYEAYEKRLNYEFQEALRFGVDFKVSNIDLTFYPRKGKHVGVKK